MSENAMCLICKTKPRRLTRTGKLMSVCDSEPCATEALRRLDRAGVIPDEMAESLGLRDSETQGGKP